MYKISEQANLQVMRRVMDVPTATAVFHVFVDDGIYPAYTDHVEVKNGVCRGLRLRTTQPEPRWTEPCEIELPNGFADVLANDAEEEAPAEALLRGLGLLPPVAT